MELTTFIGVGHPTFMVLALPRGWIMVGLILAIIRALFGILLISDPELPLVYVMALYKYIYDF